MTDPKQNLKKSSRPSRYVKTPRILKDLNLRPIVSIRDIWYGKEVDKLVVSSVFGRDHCYHFGLSYALAGKQIRNKWENDHN
ncbi:hypothetical protein GWI33_012738 [Rhynchophorus ferrugineus]|uniref:Uncharacterized protein n=1 Tax=Rhynchophorus ferrugineus TaxID=354439 RepID=A0A834MJQ5_RHYFE|nr:hypothetical protein GWI33_012738 [Rhynchophorus ferrugineus]